jgi:hypothetical protein
LSKIMGKINNGESIWVELKAVNPLLRRPHCARLKHVHRKISHLSAIVCRS